MCGIGSTSTLSSASAWCPASHSNTGSLPCTRPGPGPVLAPITSTVPPLRRASVCTRSWMRAQISGAQVDGNAPSSALSAEEHSILRSSLAQDLGLPRGAAQTDRQRPEHAGTHAPAEAIVAVPNPVAAELAAFQRRPAFSPLRAEVCGRRRRAVRDSSRQRTARRKQQGHARHMQPAGSLYALAAGEPLLDAGEQEAATSKTGPTWPAGAAQARLIGRGWPELAARSSAERGLRRAGGHRPEPPRFRHSRRLWMPTHTPTVAACRAATATATARATGSRRQT